MPSKRAMETTPFAAMDVLEKAEQLDDVVDLSVGEPDFEPPAVATEAAIDSLASGSVNYTNARGKTSLREAISAYYDREYGVDVPIERIHVTPGSSPALLMVMLDVVDPGDEVVLTDPYYAPYPNFVRQAEGLTTTVDLRPENGFQPDLADFEAAVDRDTQGLLINSPANPTGAVMDADAIEGLANLATRNDTQLIADEIYHGLDFDAEAHSVLEYTDEAFVLDGVSKRYGMTGWRLGWIVSPPAETEALNRLVQNFLICAPNHVQDGAEVAIREGDGLAEIRSVYRERRDLLLEGVRELDLDVGYTPAGAYYLLLDVSDLDGNAFDVADRLLEDAGVALTPGPDFGTQTEHMLRASFAASTNNIEEAIRRLKAYLSG
ncbi:MAG: aminotransferase class I/II-fold pyridoxal phosphate-dependent enzyme [Halodesulfurarchaeum sp.]|nr:aminotransferase class I/II-fold pyridoxal phosphate-dependent enzyme [Halodesulfurarchaeum sp.]